MGAVPREPREEDWSLSDLHGSGAKIIMNNDNIEGKVVIIRAAAK
jgi:hypothetical protein